jgi:branched-chain amino acid aminotransferase
VAGLKTTSYAENVVALALAHERGADEALFLDTRGNLSECTG